MVLKYEQALRGLFTVGTSSLPDKGYQEEIPEKVDGKQGLNSPDGECPYNVGAQIN